MATDYEPRIGFGGILKVDYGSGLTEIGHVVDVGMNIDIGEAETSHQQGPTQHATTPKAFMEAIPSKAGVELTFNVRFDPGVTEHEDVILDHLAEILEFVYEFDDDKGIGTNSKWTFDGFYRSVNPTAPLEDANTADITIRVTGAPTFAGTDESA